LPSTRTEFWHEKIHSNIVRDKKNLAACRKLGWKTLVVWECAIKGKTRLQPEELAAVMQKLVVVRRSGRGNCRKRRQKMNEAKIALSIHQKLDYSSSRFIIEFSYRESASKTLLAIKSA
jgi:G:T-mismatch repair DNA endonuclease (very short patch repair protein)